MGVCDSRQPQFDEIVDSIVLSNRHLNNVHDREYIRDSASLNPDNTISMWDLRNKKLKVLPDAFCDLVVPGSLCLEGNQLESLPSGITRLQVGGDLSFYGNNLRTLPDNIGDLTVGGNLSFAGNQLESLPKSINSITVGGTLDLSQNALKFPKTIGPYEHYCDGRYGKCLLAPPEDTKGGDGKSGCTC